MKIDWKKDLKDAMWAMFWLGNPEDRRTSDTDRENLKENVARLIRMATQKTAGQRKSVGHVDWNAMEHTVMSITLCATQMALNGDFGPMPEIIEEADI